VEALSFEEIFQSKLQTLLELDPAYTALVESDPAIKLLEADSYDELILRQRINDAARARLLAFAVGSDLDQLGVFYGVTRLTGEGDASLKVRVREAIMGRSAAGTAAQYRFAALSVSTDVADARVDSPAGGNVRISILSASGNGTPSASLVSNVRAVVQGDSVRALCHTVTVVPAEIVTVNVAAQIWLTPTASEAIFTGLEGALRDAFASARGLGYNLAPSWIVAKLQVGGVQRVELTAPTSQTVIAPNQCVALGTITLTLAGRDY
jgi:phage-related baseplate assembly protein